MKYVIPLFLIILLITFLPSCASDEPTATEEALPTPTTIETTVTEQAEPVDSEPEVTEEPSAKGDGELSMAEALESIPTRTPMPTATPGVLVQQVDTITTELGLQEQTFLGMGLDDWFILIIALTLVALVYIFATWLARRFLPRLARRTETDLDDQLISISGRELRWLIFIFALQIATVRLVFLSAGVKSLLLDIYFILALGITIRITWKLINLIEEQARLQMESEDREQQMAPLIKLAGMLARILAIVVFISILLSHFGVNVTAIAAALGLGGLAVSLAARDTVADGIAGFIILIDQPFRIGDRIEIQNLGTWGDVTDIGLRTTSIRTRDNRMVIIPNSTIGTNEIVNYSYPDPEYRIQTHIGIAYGTPIENIKKIVLEAMQGVEGVLENRPIDVLYHEMGDSAMIFRVRWWIETYADNRRVMDRVHIALQEAIDKAGFESPFNTQTIDLQINPRTATLLKGISSEVDS